MTTDTAAPVHIAPIAAPLTVGTRVTILVGGFAGDTGRIVRESYGRYLVETDSHLITGYYRAEQLEVLK
jgi:hypothetical protein